jgi:glycolate oxidase FAD binding subunit
LSHSLDGLTPSSIERPETLDELSQALAGVTSTQRTAIPWGGGTRIGVGNIPSSYDVAVDLSAFVGEIEHVAGDMTVVANAGVTIGTLNAVLEKEGQRLAFEVRNPAQATIGGSVASNAPGRRQSSTGGIRDWVIGMQIVLPDGTVTKTGGRVVKNVQGYDMHRLHTGAYGTLGVVSQTAFKLLPILPEQQTVAIWFDDVQSAQEVGMSFVNGLFTPEAIVLLSGSLARETVKASGETPPSGEIWALLVKLGGGVSSIERQAREVVGSAGANGATGYAVLFEAAANAAWTHIEASESNAGVSTRVNARTRDALSISEALTNGNEDDEASLSTICDLGFGSLTVLSLADTMNDSAALTVITSVINATSKFQSSYVIEKCPLSVKQQVDVFSDVGSSIDLMRRVKNQFDPNNTLNPGRFAGKI